MLVRDYVTKTLWDDCIKIAKANILTGSYEFVKQTGYGYEPYCLQGRSIFEYMQRVAEGGMIHPDDKIVYQPFTDKDAFARMINRAQRKITVNFRARPDGDYVWMTLEVLLPAVMAEEPMALFCWKRADDAACSVDAAMRVLANYYPKILRVDLTEDTYEIVKTYEMEKTPDLGMASTLSGWLRSFAELGNVMEQDREAFLAFSERENMRRSLRRSRSSIRCRYRRRTGPDYRWVLMELIPAEDYTDEHQRALLFIRDIHDSYVHELFYQKELEYACNYDGATGLRNRVSFERCCKEYAPGERLGILMVELKETQAGADPNRSDRDENDVRAFAGRLADVFGSGDCFRLDGGRFAVVQRGAEKGHFVRRMEQFCAEAGDAGEKAFFAGWAWTGGRMGFGEVAEHAKLRLLADKHAPTDAADSGHDEPATRNE